MVKLFRMAEDQSGISMLRNLPQAMYTHSDLSDKHIHTKSIATQTDLMIDCTFTPDSARCDHYVILP